LAKALDWPKRNAYHPGVGVTRGHGPMGNRVSALIVLGLGGATGGSLPGRPRSVSPRHQLARSPTAWQTWLSPGLLPASRRKALPSSRSIPDAIHDSFYTLLSGSQALAVGSTLRGTAPRLAQCRPESRIGESPIRRIPAQSRSVFARVAQHAAAPRVRAGGAPLPPPDSPPGPTSVRQGFDSHERAASGCLFPCGRQLTRTGGHARWGPHPLPPIDASRRANGSPREME